MCVCVCVFPETQRFDMMPGVQTPELNSWRGLRAVVWLGRAELQRARQAAGEGIGAAAAGKQAAVMVGAEALQLAASNLAPQTPRLPRGSDCPASPPPPGLCKVLGS